MAQTNDFHYSDEPEPHKARTKAILQAHPEVRELIGRNPWSALVVVAVVALQLTLAWSLRGAVWWAVPVTAFCVGAFANHAMYVMIHECAHNLVFRNRSLNMVFGILADIPNVFPSSVAFRTYHLKHHSHQGDYELDADLPNRWEARLIGSWSIGKALWLLLFPVFQLTRPSRTKELKPSSGWAVANLSFVLFTDFLIVYFWGVQALVYLLCSFFFSIGLHPLGARWIQEHYLTQAPQETYSYYGILNIPAFNVGYHNEHHDFPSVPWNRLPRVRAAAPEFYDSLHAHYSWTALLLRWIFDRELSLFSRMVRRNRGRRTATHEA